MSQSLLNMSNPLICLFLAFLSEVKFRLLGTFEQVMLPPLRIGVLIQQCSTIYAQVIGKNTAAIVTSVVHLNKLVCIKLHQQRDKH